MKLIPVKKWLFFVCLIVCNTCFSQTHVNIKGRDSLYSLQITTDTAKKYVYLYRVYGESSLTPRDTYDLSKPKLGAIKDSGKFFLAVRKFAKGDSLKRVLADTVRAYLGRSKDFKIIISLPANVGTDTVTTAAATNTPGSVTEEKGSWQILTENTSLFTILLILILLFIGAVLFIIFRKPKQNGQPFIPDELLKIFDIRNDKDDTRSTVNRIRRAYVDVQEDLGSQQRKNEQVKKQLKELEETNEALKKEMAKVNEALQKKQQEVDTIEKGNEQFTYLADKVLDKYFRDLAIMLEQNQIKDEQEIFRLILSRLIPFSMHSASLLKKQIKDATELDSLNIQLLNGEQPKPKAVITENTQFGQADPLAYYIYHLLKQFQVQGLQEVFVKGYKIGN